MLSLAIVCMLVFCLTGCHSDVVEDTTQTVSLEGHYIAITIDGVEYHVHTSSVASLTTWYNEYGEPNGWIVQDGEIYTKNKTQKIDTAGMPIDQATLWDGQSFGLIAADSDSNKKNESVINQQVASGDMYPVPELTSVEKLPSFAKNGIGTEAYCYKIDNPNYACSFTMEFNDVDEKALESYISYLEDNKPQSIEDRGNGEYNLIWDWGSISIYHNKSMAIMNTIIGVNRQ